MERSPFHVMTMKAENFMRIVIASLTLPEKGVTKIGGKNGAGKSSLIASLVAALGGGKSVPDEPIRAGSKRALSSVELVDASGAPFAKVERRFTPSNPNGDLVITAADGSRVSSPQALLDSIIGRLTLDPLAFLDQSQQEQYNALRNMVNLPVDLDAIAQQRRQLYDERTGVNRDLKSTEARLGAIQVPADAPDEEVSAADVIAEVNEAIAHNQNIMKQKAQLGVLNQRGQDARVRINALEANCTRLRQELALTEENLSHAKDDLEVLKDEWKACAAHVEALKPVDVIPIQQRLGRIEALNEQARWKASRRALIAEVEGHRKKALSLTEQIDSLDEQKRRAFEDAQYPVPGLSMDEGRVLYNGVPLSQASSAEQLRVSMEIAMAMNPALKVVCIRDGSRLDADNQETIRKLAEARDFQVLLELVKDAPEPGLVFVEDGLVVSGGDDA